MKFLNFSTIVLLIGFLSSGIQAQFIDVRAEITIDRMPEKERTDLKTLEQMLPSYFENFSWFDNTFGILIPINISVFPQSVNSSGFQRVFAGQLLINNESGDQRYYEKNFSFVYNTNDPLVHSDMPHPLTSVLDYYAWLMIAGELDTYEILGGNSAYEKARDIATRAQMSERPQGWKTRLQDLDELLRLRNYRLLKYYYWLMIDLLDQGKLKELPSALAKAQEHLELSNAEIAHERYTQIFINAHARQFMEIIKAYGSKAQAKKLMELDPENRETYEAVLTEE
jgi:hypothetical protein